MKDPRPHPMAAIFAARRAYDNARIALYRTLAAWTTGELDDADVEPSLLEIERTQAALLDAVRRHRDAPPVDPGQAGLPPIRQIGALRNFLPKSRAA